MVTEKKSITEEAKDLAESHSGDDKTTSLIVLYSTDGDKTIRLLEVTKGAAATGEVFPITDSEAPDWGLHYECSLILLHHRDWEKVQNRKLKLPSGWSEKKKQVLYSSQESI